MNILMVLLWAHMFAYQTHYFSTKINSVLETVHEARHGLNESKVAHNLTRNALVSTIEQLGACSSEVQELEDKLKISVSKNELSQSKILVLEELIEVLRLDVAQKSDHLLELQERFDQIWCWTVWVALPLSILIIFLLVTLFFLLFGFIFL